MIAPPHYRRGYPRSAVAARRILITAGPTHEPIDAVRFIGNRSSGRMGIALAEAAVAKGWHVTLLLGPVPFCPSPIDGMDVHRFRTCADLQSLLHTHAPRAGVLVMAAAVADYRPKPNPAFVNGKFRRTDGPVTLELESTPDLLAEASRSRRSDQLFVGFALEPRAELLASAESKLTRKKIDLVVANPLETMDSDSVEAMIIGADGSRTDTPGLMSKREFAPWLIDLLGDRSQTTAAPKPVFAASATAA
jgi:phosphopantothenoylcysteine decarboxylase/phosphopantothenate--cysteine ligase